MRNKITRVIVSLLALVSALPPIHKHCYAIGETHRQDDETIVASKPPSPQPLSSTQSRDFIAVSRKNFSQVVCSSEKIWVVIFYSRVVDIRVKREATLLRGTVRFSAIDRATESDFIQELGATTTTACRVYKWSSDHRNRCTNAFTDFEQAELGHCLAYARDAILQRSRLDCSDFTPTTAHLQGNWLREAFLSIPSRFPAVLLLEPDDTGSIQNLALLAAAQQMSNYYLFQCLRNATSASLNSVMANLTSERKFTIPGLFVLVAETSSNRSEHKLTSPAQVADDKISADSDKDDTVKLSALKYNATAHGSVSYARALSFLIGVNREYRPDLPGENFGHDEDILLAKDILVAEEDLFTITRSEKSGHGDSAKSYDRQEL